MAYSDNESIDDFDRVFLGIPVKNCIVVMLKTYPKRHYDEHVQYLLICYVFLLSKDANICLRDKFIGI